MKRSVILKDRLGPDILSAFWGVKCVGEWNSVIFYCEVIVGVKCEGEWNSVIF